MLFGADGVTGRIGLLAFVGATGVVHCLARMPDDASRLFVLALAITLSVSVYLVAPPVWRWRALLPLWMFVVGLLLTASRVDHRLADALSPDNEHRVARVELRVASLVKVSPDSRQFEAQVISSVPGGVPSRIYVTWSAPGWSGPYGNPGRAAYPFSELIPGQVWRMAMVLKKPHGVRNPHGFDYEGFMFAQGLRATGAVRGTPQYLHDEPWTSLPIVAQRARHHVRAAMQRHLQDKRYAAVLLALAIGDQASVPVVVDIKVLVQRFL
jgi:competence protein ComEC